MSLKIFYKILSASISFVIFSFCGNSIKKYPSNGAINNNLSSNKINPLKTISVNELDKNINNVVRLINNNSSTSKDLFQIFEDQKQHFNISLYNDSLDQNVFLLIDTITTQQNIVQIKLYPPNFIRDSGDKLFTLLIHDYGIPGYKWMFPKNTKDNRVSSIFKVHKAEIDIESSNEPRSEHNEINKIIIKNTIEK